MARSGKKPGKANACSGKICGGRDLSGNKHTNKQQSFDQKFENMNEALRLSCGKGYPVRVVREGRIAFQTNVLELHALPEAKRIGDLPVSMRCWSLDLVKLVQLCVGDPSQCGTSQLTRTS
ncbi:hypothetical protein SESBI_14305 [Sesbania bispinosa]|nr:hypothetical protein SESBI_14305 [Sesbania bispinosa]